MSENEGDIAVVLSSEMIETIAQEYFNKVMFKKKVVIASSRPASDGYMFSVNFMSEARPVVNNTEKPVDGVYDIVSGGNVVMKVSNGKLTKKEKV